MSTTNILLCMIIYLIMVNAPESKEQSYYTRKPKGKPAYLRGLRLLGGAQSKKFGKKIRKMEAKKAKKAIEAAALLAQRRDRAAW